MYLVPDSCAPTGEISSKLRRLVPGLQRHCIRCFEQFPSQSLIIQCVRSSAVGTCQCHWTRELFTRCRHWTQERFSKFQVFRVYWNAHSKPGYNFPCCAMYTLWNSFHPAVSISFLIYWWYTGRNPNISPSLNDAFISLGKPSEIYLAITSEDASIVYYKLSSGIVKPSMWHGSCINSCARNSWRHLRFYSILKFPQKYE